MKSFPPGAHTDTEHPRFLAHATPERLRKIIVPALGAREYFSSPSNQPQPTGVHNHILVVDDDAAVRDVLANFLRHSGYRVNCASDGEAGWEALCANRFDALITDHAMPRLTGLDFLRRVRSGPYKVTPAILISGEMPWEERDLLDLVRPGVAMEKPFSMLELLTSVRGVLAMATHAEAVYVG